MDVRTGKSNVSNINQSSPGLDEETTYFYSLPAEDAADGGDGEEEDGGETEDEDPGHLIIIRFTLQKWDLKPK